MTDSILATSGHCPFPPYATSSSCSSEATTVPSSSCEMGSAVYSDKSFAHVELLPNPDFVFPIRSSDNLSSNVNHISNFNASAPPAAPSSSSSSTSSTRSTSKRPLSAQFMPTSKRSSAPADFISQNRSLNIPPPFSFNPGAAPLPSSSSSSSSSSPSTSTVSATTNSSEPLDINASLLNTTSSSRSIGHKRADSEFVGGDSRSGAATLIACPTLSNTAAAPATLDSRPSPHRLSLPPGRKGHAHRRSGAISGHDLRSIMQPPSFIQQQQQPQNESNGSHSTSTVSTAFSSNISGRMSASSAPLPSTFQSEDAPLPPVVVEPIVIPPSPQEDELSCMEPSMTPTSTSFSDSQADRNSSPQSRSSSHVRVGFSETVEYIRPLSTISSETESSVSTVRGNTAQPKHESSSSIVSAHAPSHRRNGTPPPYFSSSSSSSSISSLQRFADGRISSISPSFHESAESIPNLDNSCHGKENLQANLVPMNNSTSEASYSKESEKSTLSSSPSRMRSFFSHDSKRPSIPSPSVSPFLSNNAYSETNASAVTNTASDMMLPSPAESPVLCVADSFRRASQEEEPVSTSEEHGSKHRKHTMKSWANSIIPRRSKSSSSSSPFSHQCKEKECDSKKEQACSDSPTFADVDESIIPFDLLDVDNTVTIVEEATQDSTSAQTLNSPRFSFDASDLPSCSRSMYYDASDDDRNAVIDLDAALGPFNTPGAGGVRGGRNANSKSGRFRRTLHSGPYTSSMLGSLSSTHRRTESAPELLPFEARASLSSAPTMADVFEEEEEEEEEEEGAAKDADESLKEESVDLRQNEQQQISALQYPRPCSGQTTCSTVASVVSTATSDVGRLSTDAFIGREMLSTPEDRIGVRSIVLNNATTSAFFATPETYSNSTFSSPSFSHSEMSSSFDTPRVGTAASSVTDSRTMNSFCGEPGPDICDMNEDVPSVSSSYSTTNMGLMTLENMPHDVRAVSMSSLGLGAYRNHEAEPRKKRNSIASLSRLMGVGGTFGERSKLSIEQRPQSECVLAVKEVHVKKGSRRFSRMIRFWKSKEAKISE